eukprot:GHVO01067416.1.p1 GENE.GHVO01067416.1~~GHVO01067416.1.p1  ORF type:complete len:341 (+),score=82.69 GHVO01067416.1:29-1051(+)
MRLRVKNVQNAEQEVDIDPEKPVRDAKDIIKAKFNMETDIQLIHAGRILNDEVMINATPIKDNDRVIIIGLKSTPKPPAAAPTPAPVAAPAAPPAPAAAPVAAPAAAGNGETQPPQDGESQDIEGDSVLLTGDRLQQVIEDITAMGFERSQVEQAVEAAFNNPDRALDYLLTGIPPAAEPQQQQAPPPAAATVAPPATGGASAGALGTLEEFRRHPMFEEIRNAIQTNPEVLSTILGIISQRNPDLAEQIINNQDAFLQMINEPIPAESNEGRQMPIQIEATPQDMAAVERLEGLGFPRIAALQAYMACEKNEDLAANYLFDNIGDFAEEDDGTDQPPAM